MVITSPTAYCLVSIATTLQKKQTSAFFPRQAATTLILVSPFEVGGVDSLVADGTLGPAPVAQTQVVQHARPAEDMTTASDARRHWRVQADGARRHLVAVNALETHRADGQ